MTVTDHTSERPSVAWLDDNHLEVDGVRFAAATLEDRGSGGQLLIVKPAHLVQRYLDLIDRERPRRIVELGVKEGGSTALVALAARPEVFVAVDLGDEPPMLADLIRDRGLQDRVVTRFGLDQADRDGLLAVVGDAMAGEPIDLVVDDASHVLAPTIASFDALFPHLREGGLYVIEDWSADNHVAALASRYLPADLPDRSERLSQVRSLVALLNAPGSPVPPEVTAALSETYTRMSSEARIEVTDRPEAPLMAIIDLLVEVACKTDLPGLPPAPRPLSDLAVLLTLLAVEQAGVVADVQVDGEWIAVRRGPAPVDPASFSLRTLAPDHFGYLA